MQNNSQFIAHTSDSNTVKESFHVCITCFIPADFNEIKQSVFHRQTIHEDAEGRNSISGESVGR